MVVSCLFQTFQGGPAHPSFSYSNCNSLESVFSISRTDLLVSPSGRFYSQGKCCFPYLSVVWKLFRQIGVRVNCIIVSCTCGSTASSQQHDHRGPSDVALPGDPELLRGRAEGPSTSSSVSHGSVCFSRLTPLPPRDAAAVFASGARTSPSSSEGQHSRTRVSDPKTCLALHLMCHARESIVV